MTRFDELHQAIATTARIYHLGLTDGQVTALAVAALKTVRPPAPRPAPIPTWSSGDTSLSPRLQEVLQGMANGRSNAQIGQDLDLSLDTVKTYARKLFAELDANDRAHAVAQGFLRGHLVGAGVAR